MNKILVVDDNDDILSVVQLILTSNGFEVSATSNGDNAIALTNEFKPDLVLLDIYLGGIDGRDICRSLKANEATSHIPVIMFSAHGSRQDVFDKCDAQDFISKPFEIKEFVGKIKYQLAQAS
ncbi:MAG: hypothetical protein NVS3B19_04560 [Ginsengibacter sp.]